MKRFRALPRWFKRRIGYARLLCLALLIGFAALRIADPAPVEEIRVRTFDAFQRIDPRKKTARPVTIVDIDDKSLEKLGQWPWPRTRIADLVTELTRLGAVVIAFDAVFSEPDRLNPAFAADTFRNLDEETRARLRALPSNDQVFADAIRASRVVLGESGLPEEIAPLDKTLPVTGLAMLGEEPQRFMFDFPGLLRNVPVLEHAAAGRGLFTIRPERDGIMRRVPMIMQAQGQTMPSLTFEMLRVATGSGTILIKAEKGRHQEPRHQGRSDSDRPQRPALGSLCPQRCLDLCPRDQRAGEERRARHDRRQAGADRHLGGRPQRHQDHAGFARHARRGNPCPGAGEHLDRRGDLAADLRHRRRIRDRASVRAAGDRVCAAVRAGHAGRPRRGVCNRADRNVGVFLRAAPSADRFHLSPDVDHGDLSHADLFEFRARAGAAPADPLGVRRSICRRRWSSSWRSRRKSSCSAARSAR